MNHPYKLSPIKNPLNSFLFEKEYDDADRIFLKLTVIAETLPRTRIIKKENDYWKGVCRSLIFRFPDDLEILKIKYRLGQKFSNGIIQIRSASRFGQSDLGVNKRRIATLISRLDKFN